MKPDIFRKVIASACLSIAVWSAHPAFGITTESDILKEHAPGFYVYKRNVNGHQLKCFDDDTDALNGYLQQRDNGTYRIVLRPGPSEIRTWVKQTPVPCTWTLEDATNSIYRATEEVFGIGPLITVYVGEKIQLDKLKIPSQMRLVGPEEQKEVYRNGVNHNEDDVRSRSARRLAQVDPYDFETVCLLVSLLSDKSEQVCSAAARALSMMGNCATTSLPELRVALQQASKYRESFERAIEKLEEHNDTNAAEGEFRTRYKAIVDFVARMEQERAAAK